MQFDLLACLCTFLRALHITSCKLNYLLDLYYPIHRSILRSCLLRTTVFLNSDTGSVSFSDFRERHINALKLESGKPTIASIATPLNKQLTIGRTMRMTRVTNLMVMAFIPILLKGAYS